MIIKTSRNLGTKGLVFFLYDNVMLTMFGEILTWLFILNFNLNIRDAPSRARHTPLVSEGPVVRLIIEPTPGNRGLSQFPPHPAGNQMGGILIIPTSQDSPDSRCGRNTWNVLQEGNVPKCIPWP